MSENAPTRSLDDIDLAALRVSINTQSCVNGSITCCYIKEMACDTTTTIKHQRN